MKDNKKIIWLGLTISLFFFSVFILTKDTTPLPTLPLIKGEEKGGGQTFLEINREKLETTVIENENVYDFMVKLQEEGKIRFKDKIYSGMGKLIEEINGLKNGDKYWIYYVNGKKADIGVSNYKINKGDIVSWKYEKNY